MVSRRTRTCGPSTSVDPDDPGNLETTLWTCTGIRWDISKDGAYIIVGAPLNVSGRGHVSVYTLSGTDFVFKGRPLVRDVIEPEFGRQVSITDNGLAFVTNAGASATSAGKLIKYLFENNIWVEFATIATSTVPNLRFGNQ